MVREDDNGERRQGGGGGVTRPRRGRVEGGNGDGVNDSKRAIVGKVMIIFLKVFICVIHCICVLLT